MMRAALVALLLMSIGSTSIAEEVEDYDWPAFQEIQAQAQRSDSTKLLAKVFGDWVYAVGVDDVVMGSEQGARTPMTIYANMMAGAGFSLFMFLAAYVLIVGLVKTSQEGEFFGRDWNTTWVLARMLATMILISPIGSMPAGQYVVMYAAKYSAATADLVWGRTLNAIGRERTRVDGTFNAVVSIMDGMHLVGRGFAHGACIAARNQSEGVLIADLPEIDVKRTMARWGLDCGMDMEVLGNHSARAFAMNVEPQKELDWSWAPESNRRAHAMRQAAIEVAARYYNSAFMLGRKVVEHRVHELVPDARALAAGFVRDFRNETNAAMSRGAYGSIDAFSAEAERAGWVQAGSLYRQLAKQQTAISTAVSDAVGYGGELVNPEKWGSVLRSDDMVYSATTGAYRIWEDGAIGEAIGASGELANEQTAAARAAGNAMEFFGLNILRAGDSADPIEVATTWGRVLGTVSQADMAAQLNPAYKIGTWLADKASDGKISLLRNIIFGAAIFLTVVVPSLPWIYVMLAALAWLTHVIEMFVCAPLWIAAHAAPEGKEHTSNLAAKGYNNALFVIFYPVLVVGGLIAAMTVSWIGVSLLNHFIAAQFIDELAGYGGAWALITRGLPTLIGFILLYCALLWMVLSSSFNLVQAFPRTLLDWLSTAPAGTSAFQQAGEHASHTAVSLYNIGGGKAVGQMVGSQHQKAIPGDHTRNNNGARALTRK